MAPVQAERTPPEAAEAKWECACGYQNQKHKPDCRLCGTASSHNSPHLQSVTQLPYMGKAASSVEQPSLVSSSLTPFARSPSLQSRRQHPPRPVTEDILPATGMDAIRRLGIHLALVRWLYFAKGYTLAAVIVALFSMYVY